MSGLEVGSLLLLDSATGPILARVVRGKRNETRIETDAGVRTLAEAERWLPLPLRASTLAQAEAQVTGLRARVAPNDIKMLLEALTDEATTVGAITEALLSARGPEDRAATLIALADAAGEVVVNGHTVRRRTEAEISARETEHAATRAASVCLDELNKARAALLTFGQLQGDASAALADYLEAMATGGAAPSPGWERALLGRSGRIGGARSGRSLASGAARALADLQIWDGHEDLALLRSGLLAPWPAPANRGLAAQPSVPAGGLPTCPYPLRAIDSVDPDEVDDALWATREGDHIRLVVAFASPSLWLTPNTPADLEARKRGVTLYHPRHIGPMLPSTLLDQSSLTVNGPRPALVCELLIGAEGIGSLDRIYEAEVTLTEALVYDDVQLTLEGDAPLPDWLEALRESTRRGEAARIAAGAYLLYRPDIEVRAPPHKTATLRPAPQSTLARRLVAESMVQACAAIGERMRGAGVALPYRTQQIRPDPPLPAGFYVEPADVQSMLGHLGAAKTGARAGRHDILGVESYVQISSPLRRYPDLVAHYQLIAWLRGQKTPFDRGHIDSVLKNQRSAVRERRAAGRRGQRYFQLLGLAREGLGAKLRAQVIRAGGPQGRSVAFDGDRVLQIDLPGYLGPVGTWLALEVVEVDAADGKLRVQVIAD